MGELLAIYHLADAVFVGGSLVPRGGHNIMEPALFEKPILFGPHMNNFREIASLFRRPAGRIDGSRFRGVSRQINRIGSRSTLEEATRLAGGRNFGSKPWGNSENFGPC